MNSTEDTPQISSSQKTLEKRLKRFYLRHVARLDVPCAQEGRGRISAESFWIERDGSSPCAEDFEVSLGDDLDMALTLELSWSETVLSGLGTPLARLARRFPRDEKEEVSSFVYEMF